jgi:hypothetical protein
MKTNHRWTRVGGSLLAAVLVSAAPGHAQTRQQTLNLHAGWNAVFLEVEPADTNPQAVFTNTPVDIVARYFPRTSPVQYISNPSDAPWNEPGWGVWYAPSRPEAVVSSLYAIHGHKAYLVRASANYTWRVTGQATFARQRWQADSFNLVGFGVDEQAPPTMERFFAGADGRIGQRVYRLDTSGNWQPVTFPASATLNSGEAYWVYCRGKTDYQGPLDLKVSGLEGLDFGSTGTQLSLQFFNASPEAATIAVEMVAGGGDLPLAQVVQDLSTLQRSYPDLPALTQLPTLPSGQMNELSLQVRRETMSASAQTRLLKVTSSQGVRFWIPVRAERSDLVGQP